MAGAVTKHQFKADTSSWERGIASMRKQADKFNKGVAKDFGGINKAFDGLGKSVLGVNSGIAKLAGGLATFTAVGASFAVMGEAINKIKDFEKANDVLAAVSGATASQMEELTGQAKMLGSTTAYSASQVTELQTELAKLGFQVPEIKASTDAVLKLASATGAELGESASLAGATLRAFGLDASEMGRVASVLAVSTTKSALSFEKLNNGMSTVAPVAKAFGFSVEDTVAMLGKLSDAGFDASSAATATRNIFLNLANSNGKLAKALGHPVHNAKELADGLVELRNKGVDLNEALAMTDKRSVAAFETFLASAEGVAKLSEELTGCNEDLDKMVATMTDNLQGSLDSLGSAWEGLMLSFSGSSGIIRDVVDAITKLVQGLTKLMQTENEYAKGKAMAVVAEAEAKRSSYLKNEERDFNGLVAEYKKLNEQQQKGLTDEQIINEILNERQNKFNSELKSHQDRIKALDAEIALWEQIAKEMEGAKNGREKLAITDKYGIDRKWAEKNSMYLNGSADKYLASLQTEKGHQQAAVIQSQAKLDFYNNRNKETKTEPIKIDAEIEVINETTIRKKIAELKKERSYYNYTDDAYKNLTIAIQDYERQLEEISGKKQKQSKADAPAIKIEYQDLLNSTDTKAIENALQSMDDDIVEFMAKGGELAGAEWMESFRKALEDRLSDLRFNEQLAKELSNAGDEYQKQLSSKPTKIEFDQDGLKAYGELLGNVSDGLNEFSEESKAANAVLQMLNVAQTALNGVMAVQQAITEASAAASTANATAKSAEASATMTDAAAQATDTAASLANATAKSAEAVSGATASGAKLPFPANIAAIAAGVAVVISMLSMAKTMKFANGGIVGGTSYAGDKVPAMLNSGEMVLNQQQQSNLFRLLNGGTFGNGGNININMAASGKEMKATINNYNATMNRLK